MVYNYECLNELSFQKFVQALILAEYPDTQCLPVSQPDGGRDAIFLDPESEGKGFFVFQIKFTKNPGTKTERKVIEDLILSENLKVQELIKRGATRYFLITNVQGTSHLDVGSIDKNNEALSNALCIPCSVWWRDDLDARLDNAPNIKWSYPEVLRATDILPLLVTGTADQRELQSTRTIKSYMATQYVIDREIKFKQVELKRSLIHLFVDLPIRQKRRRKEHEDARQVQRLGVSGYLESYVRKISRRDRYESDDDRSSDLFRLAASFWLNMPLIEGVARFVLEGAPGQGKSTVTQFLCQVNRLRILSKRDELDGVGDEHRSGPVRAPF